MTREAPLEEPSPAVVMRVVDRAIDAEVTAASRVEEGLNAIYRVQARSGRSWILKLATFNDAAELRVEAHILERIQAETDVPTPALVGTFESATTVLPAFAYLMTPVNGRRIRDVTTLSLSGRERFVQEVGEHLGAIHNLRTASRFGEPRLRDGTLTVPDGHEDVGSWLAEQATNAAAKLRGEGYVTDDEPRFVELATPVHAALSTASWETETVEPVLTHGDPRPANMIFAPGDDGRPLVRGLIDVGGPITDGLSDLANAEIALIDVPVGGTDEADQLRSRLRSAYETQRGVAPVDDQPRYAYYRLLHRARTLAGFEWWKQFARESSDEATARRFRSEARALLRAVE